MLRPEAPSDFQVDDVPEGYHGVRDAYLMHVAPY
jgi:hypothetical protein